MRARLHENGSRHVGPPWQHEDGGTGDGDPCADPVTGSLAGEKQQGVDDAKTGVAGGRLRERYDIEVLVAADGLDEMAPPTRS